MMIKLIHAADLHLDSPFSGLDPQQAAERRGEQRELLGRLAELARERKADAVLLSGDLLDTGRTFRETAELLSAHLGSTGCPVFIAPGNHDFYQGNSPYAAMEWPENVHIFHNEQVECVELPDKNCVIHGAAFTSARQSVSPLHGFRVPDDGRTHVMVLHGEVDGSGDYGTIARADIAASGLDYLALGHVHQYSGLNQEGQTCWAYPGCPEGRGFDELGEKGVLYLEVENGTVREEFVPLARRRYQILKVDLTGQSDPLSAIRTALPVNTGEDIYRIILTGERPEGLNLSVLQRELEGGFYALTLRDKTRAARQVWARMEEDTLTGLFLREMSRLCGEDPENETLQLAVRFGLAALEGGEDVCP